MRVEERESEVPDTERLGLGVRVCSRVPSPHEGPGPLFLADEAKIGVGIITNNIPLWSLENYAIVTPQIPIQAPTQRAQN